MFRSFLFVFLLLNSQLILAAKTSEVKTDVNTTGTILIVGDSISSAYGFQTESGWAHLLSLKVTQEKKPYQVINASISGDTTINGLNRFKSLLDKYHPQVIIIELGGNDGLRGLSVKVMKHNLSQMIKMSLPESKVLLAGMKIPPNYGKRYTEAFYQVYQDLAIEHSVELIPFILDGIGGKSELMQADGIHPNAKAQSLILATVWKKLKTML